MATILSKFLGATDYKPSRITAWTADKNPSTGKKDRVTLSYEHALSGFDNHKVAVEALNRKQGWGPGEYVVGQTEDCYVFVRSSTVLIIGEEG